jgi:hypothetical protein
MIRFYFVIIYLTALASALIGASGAVSISFVGTGTALSAADTAGVVAKPQWNNATGAKSASALSLLDETGTASGATVAWTADNTWNTPVTDTAGNNRMMRGYLDNAAGNPTIVTVAGLSPGAYSIYVYTDGDNSGFSRTGAYQITGSGITATSVNATDAANVNFSGSFVQASNSAGNYVIFRGIAITSGFTLTATPVSSTSGLRAPVNAIQIIPAAPAPDFTISAAPSSQTVTIPGSTSYSATIAPLNGFIGTVALSVTGLPPNAKASFNPASVTASGPSTLTINPSNSTPAGSYTLTVTGSSGALVHNASLNLTVNASGINVDFSGSNTTAMASSESAGVVPGTNWNSAAGAVSSSPLKLLSQTGAATGATISWAADNTWNTPVTDTAGNNRMMRGYLDNGSLNPTTVTVAGLSPATYSIYVYTDGDNSGFSRTGAYQISGPGITTTGINATDAANVNFSGSFVPASNSTGNYVVFSGISITSGFTLTATPVSSTFGLRAPVNAIQIIPAGAPAPDFTISATPSSKSTAAPGSTSYTAAIAPLNGFIGTVNLSVGGLPTGATVSFNPTSVTASGTSTMTVTLPSGVSSGTSTLTITGKSGPLTHTATVSLIISGAANFTLSATPPSQNVTAGHSTTYTATIAPLNGFNGTVTLSASGLPANAMASFNPATVTTSGSSTMTVTTTANTPTGTSTLTIKGTSGGLTQSATVSLVVNSATGAGPVSDDFHSSTLNTSLWAFENPLGDAVAWLDGTHLLISLPSGTAHDGWSEGPNTEARVVQTIQNTDFDVTAKFDGPFATECQDEGILVEQDSLNYARFDVYWSGPNPIIFAAQISNGNPTQRVSFAMTNYTVPIFLRVQRTGNTFTYNISTDNVNWMQAGSFAFTLAASKLGVYAGNSTCGYNPPRFTAKVDYFFNTQNPIVPEDGVSGANPEISVWYGDTQNFGQNGTPQQWVNILGTVLDPAGISSLTYTLNGGAPQNLWIGENNRRLVSPGDFNVEIDHANLNPGANNVVITAVDNLGNRSTHTVVVNYTAGVTWPSTYSIDWSSVSNIQSVAQIVDGVWAVQPDGSVRTMQPGYDRLIALGDWNNWLNYTMTAEVTMHNVDDPFIPEPPGFDGGFGFGIVMGWKGHTTVQYGVALPDQPRSGHPFPALAWYAWDQNRAVLELHGNTPTMPEYLMAADPSDYQLSFDVKYIFKVQTQQISGSQTQYSFKVWPASATEPANWTVTAIGDLSQGGVLLAAYRSDVSFGKVNVIPSP